VKKFLGEGGKKKVYLAHDTLLDRDAAFVLIKTEGLDEAASTQRRCASWKTVWKTSSRRSPKKTRSEVPK